jgi:hypothetical protein
LSLFLDFGTVPNIEGEIPMGQLQSESEYAQDAQIGQAVV